MRVLMLARRSVIRWHGPLTPARVCFAHSLDTSSQSLSTGGPSPRTSALLYLDPFNCFIGFDGAVPCERPGQGAIRVGRCVNSFSSFLLSLMVFRSPFPRFWFFEQTDTSSSLATSARIKAKT